MILLFWLRISFSLFESHTISLVFCMRWSWIFFLIISLNLSLMTTTQWMLSCWMKISSVHDSSIECVASHKIIFMRKSPWRDESKYFSVFLLSPFLYCKIIKVTHSSETWDSIRLLFCRKCWFNGIYERRISPENLTRFIINIFFCRFSYTRFGKTSQTTSTTMIMNS